MSAHQHYRDEEIVKRLIELGKTPECICDIITSEVPNLRFDVDLEYDMGCPVHFPLTSEIIGRSHTL